MWTGSTQARRGGGGSSSGLGKSRRHPKHRSIDPKAWRLSLNNREGEHGFIEMNVQSFESLL